MKHEAIKIFSKKLDQYHLSLYQKNISKLYSQYTSI